MGGGRPRRSPLQLGLGACCVLLAVWGWALALLGLWGRLGSAALGRLAGAPPLPLLHLGGGCTAAGGALVGLGAAGAWGAWTGRPRLLLAFLVALLVLLVAEVAMATFLYDYRAFARSLVLDRALRALRWQYGTRRGGALTQAWDSVMSKLRCCGVRGPGDFAGSAFGALSGRRHPRSCCRPPAPPACDGRSAQPELVHQQGCYRKLLGLVRVRSLELGAAATVAAGLQLVTAVLALLLYLRLQPRPAPPADDAPPLDEAPPSEAPPPDAPPPEAPPREASPDPPQ